jgi:hypothetical protein
MPDLSNIPFAAYDETAHYEASTFAVDASYRNLSHIPKKLTTLSPKLRYLNLKGNNIQMDAEDMAIIKGFPLIEYLDLSGNNITKKSVLVDIISGKDNKLWYVNLSGNNLSALNFPEQKLSTIKVLYIANNHIAEIGDGIASFVGLEDLDLSVNPLKKISWKIMELSKLSELNMFKDGLSPDVAYFVPSHVRKLSLAFNNITTLNEEMRSCKDLVEIEMSGNPIHAIPDWLSELPSLEVIFARNTKISSVPESVARIKNLKKFILSGSPIGAIPNVLQPYLADGRLLLIDEQVKP